MKWKALFQIFLILTSIFSVVTLTPLPVAAQQQKVCCEETTTGEHCQYVEQNLCKPGSLQAATSCDQTSFCKLGCGFDSTSGRCFTNTPKATCQSTGDCTWTESPSCDIPQCQRGCCVLSNQCSFVTQLQCKQITSQFAAINMTFDESITDEFTCINECRSFERGACVQSDGSCTFTTRNACSIQTTQITNSTGPKTGFYPNRFCSNPQLGTECAPQQTTGCLPDRDEVYWFDSCGNPENIYSADKRTSYNNGFVLDKEQSCNPTNNNMNSASCGNCNFPQGTLCGKAPNNIQPTYGDYTCLDLSCKDLTVSPTSPASQTGTKKLGESWCAYDGIPGFGRDFVGSRHYRRICINGEELTEPCKDYREEICVQGVQGQPPLATQQSFQLTQGNYVEALCRPNRYSSCTTTLNQLDCENVQSRDCYWIGERKEDEQGQRENKNGKCVPLVSPGLKFWPEQSQIATSTLDPKATCNTGNQECTVTFQRPGLLGNPLGGQVGRDWKCVSNCQCLEKEYLQSTNNLCKSLGDCGAWYNIKGVFTEGGFIESSDADLTVQGVESYNSLVSPTAGKSDYDSKFGAFFKQAAPGLIIIGGTGAGLAIASLIGGSSLKVAGSALFGGFFSGTSGFFSIGAIGSPSQLAGVASRGLGNVAWGSTSALSYSGMEAGTYFVSQASKEAFAGLVKEGLIEKVGVHIAEDGTEQVVYQALKEIPTSEAEKIATELTILEPNWLGGVLQILNTIAWIYTIYSLLDILFADTKTQIITTTCAPWTAPTGGSNCEQCNEEGKECSEYRCKSLGQNCKLLNPGTKLEACVDSNPNDATSPIILADQSALNKGYTLSEVQGQGFTVNQQIEPFTPVSLGITTNEYAQCRFSLESSQTFEQMTNPFGGGAFELKHSMTFSLPSLLARPEALKLTNGGKYTLYVRCQDGNSNKNAKSYYMKFAIKPGPDITAPVIESTSIANGAFMPAGVNTTSLTLYTNEPSSCKWDDIDREFEQMTNTFACTQSPLPTTSLYYGLYDCTTILSNIQTSKRNMYYVRCKDQANNINAESFVYALQGTQPLSLSSINPLPGTQFFVPDVLLKVITSQGALGGQALCGYSFVDNNPANAIEFVSTNSSVHEQQFQGLVPGFYNTYVTCADVAGNLVQGQTNFTVSIDKQGPFITNIYTQGTILHISTDEASSCEFSTTGSFSFGQGTPMAGGGTTEHETTLEDTLYYITCRDSFSNDASYKIFV